MGTASVMHSVRKRIVVGAASRSSLVRQASFRWRWASTRRLDPLSEWGYERGTPVDRYYIERFLREQQGVVRGTVLEVKEDLYASSLGADEVEILDIDRRNAAATITGDVCSPETLPTGAFDCAVITQTLQLVPDPRAALENLLASLRPAGTLLVTVPTTCRLVDQSDRWRWTARGFSDLVELAGGAGEIQAVGNLVACRAFLLGAAVEELPTGILDQDDPDYPLVVTAVLHRKN